jgi:septal ring factor EnvC (AmiA/AmiB activator)
MVFICKQCKYTTNVLCNFTSHNKTKKHIKNIVTLKDNLNIIDNNVVYMEMKNKINQLEHELISTKEELSSISTKYAIANKEIAMLYDNMVEYKKDKDIYAEILKGQNKKL